MALETLKITELGLEFYVLEKVPPQMGKSQNLTRYGSPGRARTADLMINSHPLYRLSYRGMSRNLKWIPVIGQEKG